MKTFDSCAVLYSNSFSHFDFVMRTQCEGVIGYVDSWTPFRASLVTDDVALNSVTTRMTKKLPPPPALLYLTSIPSSDSDINKFVI